MLDTRWLDELPAGDYLGTLDAVAEKLRALAADGVALNHAALEALIRMDEHCVGSIAVLTEQYCKAPTLVYEIDERLWQAVTGHYHALAKVYQLFLDAYSAQADGAPSVADLPRVLFNLLDCQRNLAKWRYFRYQPMAEGGWLKLHSLYRLAETYGCALTRLSRYSDGSATTLVACYLETLMLGTLNHTNMQKVEVELVSDWLVEWCVPLRLSADLDPQRHLFFVDLDEDRTGRRLRNTEPVASYRYWDLDQVEQQIEQLKQTLQQSVPHLKFPLAMGVRPHDALRLVDHLLGEWSREDYQRQRRTDDRDGVTKLAQVVNGILNVCQQVKNVSVAHPAAHEAFVSTGIEVVETTLDGEIETGETLEFPGAGGEKWHIENESRNGFGAVVNADLNLWLRPGRLIVVEDQHNLDMSPVGVVRSIKQLGGNQRYVGVEVLSHTPAYVRMRSLSDHGHHDDFLATDIFTVATLTTVGEPPFAALYLPKDEERGIKASLLMPMLEFIERGLYELRTEHAVYQVRLGHVIEQKDDWVRVQAVMLEKAPKPAS